MKSNRFSYVRYDSTSMAAQTLVREKVEQLEALADDLFPAGRAKSLFLTALEEAYMWSGKAIRDGQIARTGQVDEQAERNNE